MSQPLPASGRGQRAAAATWGGKEPGGWGDSDEGMTLS